MKWKQFAADQGFRALNVVHRNVVRVSGGRVGRSAFGMPVVTLHSVGRRSGLDRTTLLTVPVTDGHRYVLVASKGGDDRDPEWFLNVQAHPEIELTVDGRRRALRARVASSVESDELWPQIIHAYRPYDSYRRRTSRDIPLVICEARADRE